LICLIFMNTVRTVPTDTLVIRMSLGKRSDGNYMKRRNYE